MAFTINGSVAIDESSGLQIEGATGDATGNDVSAGTLPDAFDAILQEVLGAGVTPTDVAVSNADADNPTGTALITNLGDDVVDLSFTDANGDPLDGVAAKYGTGATDFLLTADGFRIYLYSYTGTDLTGVDENNVVFGRKANADGTANENGDIVFAAYLEPTGATGAGINAGSVTATGPEPVSTTPISRNQRKMVPRSAERTSVATTTAQ